MSMRDWEWMFVDDGDVEEVGEAERELAERRDEAGDEKELAQGGAAGVVS